MDYTLPVSTLKASLFTMAKKDVRFYLNGAFLDFRKGRIVSTDGHCLFCGQIPYLDHDSVILPREMIEQAVKSVGKRGLNSSCFLSVETVQHDENSTVYPLKLSTAYGTTFCGTAIDGAYPEYERVINLNPSGEPVTFDPEILLACRDAINAYSGNERHAYWVRYNGQASALIPGPNCLAVAMPVRAADDKVKDRFNGKPAMQVAA